MFIVLPTDVQPLYELYLPLNGESAPKGELTSIYVDPTNGETVASIDSFHLADFLYGLHIDLNLPFGDHIVGVITLFLWLLFLPVLLFSLRNLLRIFLLPRFAVDDALSTYRHAQCGRGNEFTLYLYVCVDWADV